MIREYLSQYSILPLSVMIVFILSFLYFTYSAIRMSRQDSSKFSQMPLELDDRLETEKATGGISHGRS